MERKQVEGVTIDAEHTRDIDDAIWIEEDDEGSVRVLVSIADVAEVVPPSSEYDRRARDRVATRYFASGNDPMLPRWLSERALSLWPGEPRRAITVDIQIDPETTQVVGSQIYLSTIVSQARCTYDRVPRVLEDPSHVGHAMIRSGTRIAMRLLEARRRSGAMAIVDLHRGWISTEDGALRQIANCEETIGHILVQEMMILANVQVAELCVRADLLVPLRNHVAASAAPDRSVLLRQLEDALTTPISDLEVWRHRTDLLLGRARYGHTLLGHYGLNLPAYLHFTSPIRRYADLVVHQQIRAHLAGDPLPYTSSDVEEIARHINEHEDRDREQARRAFKQRAESQVARAIVRARTADLDDAQIERAIKMHVRSGDAPPPELEAEITSRLEDGKLPVIGMTAVMTAEPTTGWAPVRLAIVRHLARAPHDVIALLSQATQVAGWGSPTYEVTQEGPGHAPTFRASATMERPAIAHEIEVSGVTNPMINPSNRSAACEAWGATSKQAKQRAAVLLVAQIARVPLPQEVQDLITPPAKRAEPEPTPTLGALGQAGEASRDPVSALMEYAQKARAAAPEFQFEQDGPSHAPKITCACSLLIPARGIFAGVGSGLSKSEAKKAAAREVLSKLAAGRALVTATRGEIDP